MRRPITWYRLGRASRPEIPGLHDLPARAGRASHDRGRPVAPGDDRLVVVGAGQRIQVGENEDRDVGEGRPFRGGRRREGDVLRGERQSRTFRLIVALLTENALVPPLLDTSPYRSSSRRETRAG